MAISDIPRTSPYGFITVWLKGANVFSLSQTDTATIVCCYDNNTGPVPYKSFILQLVKDAGQSCFIEIKTGFVTLQSDSVAILDGNWHNIMVSWDFHGSTLIANFYVDDVAAGSFNTLGIFAPLAIKYYGLSWIVGNVPEGNRLGQEYDHGYYGSIAELFMLMDQPVDITNQNTRHKFIVEVGTNIV